MGQNRKYKTVTCGQDEEPDACLSKTLESWNLEIIYLKTWKIFNQEMDCEHLKAK